jgi:hypothetical protein
MQLIGRKNAWQFIAKTDPFAGQPAEEIAKELVKIGRAFIKGELGGPDEDS